MPLEMLLRRSRLLTLGLRLGLVLPGGPSDRVVLATGTGYCDTSGSERAHLGKRAQEEEPVLGI
jgi:hypothetical protein